MCLIDPRVHCSPVRTASSVLSPAEQEEEALCHELQPLIGRLLQRHAGATEADLHSRLHALVAGYDPACGIPLRPYLLRHLTAFAASRAEIVAEGANRPNLETALRALPARGRQAVIARYYEGASLEEIAQRLRVEPEAARSLLGGAIDTLRGPAGSET